MVETKKTVDMLGRTGLIPVAQAQQLLLDQLTNIRTKVEQIQLEDALDRVLACDMTSSENLPAYPWMDMASGLPTPLVPVIRCHATLHSPGKS